ncbi:thioredoxin domain-containing protein [Candidatus Uhrbacteria bacterium]|nr:thioredoxin domain-containing protein [Candidatus Uhrbacteria bacterium]MBD3284488.1 thioredoxin domain-containing protein [Candidatus Uhrbacteria bacterium]
MAKTLERVIWARRILFGLALMGLFIASYLFITYTYSTSIACGTGHGCDLVRASQWSNWYGIPTPLLGMIYYTIIAGLLIIRTVFSGWKTVWMYRLLMVSVSVGVIESGFLTFLQIFEIKAICSWCIASSVTAALMFITAWWDKAEKLDEPTMIKELKTQFLLLVLAAVVGTIAIVILVTPQTSGERPVIEPYTPSAEEERAAQMRLYPEGLSYDGPASAPVTIVEFIDLECPACRSFYTELKNVQERYSEDVRIAYRHFPLPIHQHAKEAAYAAVCADEQGKQFAYIDNLLSEEGLERDDLIRYAAELRLDLDRFVPCLTATSTKERVEQDLHDGSALGVNATPTIFLNTTQIDGLPNAEQLGTLIESMR